MQSDHSLPDELISEILTRALKVSEETFCNTDPVSPFANFSESTSAYLLVCKSWLHVATPLLYNVVVVRSKAQAKALSIALSGNKQLGLFIRKLRVEGGFGSPMHVVLKCSPNISDLFLSFDIFSSDNTSGLCKGLPLINPTRLILWASSRKSLENKMLLQLLQSLSDAIAKWDNLRIFDCPFEFASHWRLAHKLVPPIVKAKRLDTLAIQSAHNIAWTYSQFKDCPLKAIHIKRPVSMAERNSLSEDPDLIVFSDFPTMGLLKFSDRPRGVWDVPAGRPELLLITPSLDSSFVPLKMAPSAVKDHIWTRVMHFAMLLAANHSSTPSSGEVATRLGLLLVSKLFYRLGRPLFHKHITFRRPAQINKFAHILAQSPVIGQYVRSININFGNTINFEFYDSDVVRNGSSSLTSILSQASALVRFGGHLATSNTPTIYWDAFAAMAKCSGRTLRECSLNVWPEEGVHSATIFDNLTALRILNWDSDNIYTDIESADVKGLSSLEELRSTTSSASFLDLLCHLQLKCIRRVEFSDADSSIKEFLVTHGSKLTELELAFPHLGRLKSTKIFDLCSNLYSITFFEYDDEDEDEDESKFLNPPSVQHLYSSQVVHPLTKITFKMYWYKEKKQVIAAWDPFFSQFKPECFPNLHDLEVTCCSWPTSEREIAKSCWVRWSEFLRPRGIALTDKMGMKWRPRLKVK
ncbi:F-box domain-containing protein [Favolaschia claudopus]|uniref:F-box domain-containing protein n=1 Tax=Favolaschia claudopus TaxID=2862362 RepID=A0AAW0BIK0_9AGAR